MSRVESGSPFQIASGPLTDGDEDEGELEPSVFTGEPTPFNLARQESQAKGSSWVIESVTGVPQSGQFQIRFPGGGDVVMIRFSWRVLTWNHHELNS